MVVLMCNFSSVQPHWQQMWFKIFRIAAEVWNLVYGIFFLCVKILASLLLEKSLLAVVPTKICSIIHILCDSVYRKSSGSTSGRFTWRSKFQVLHLFGSTEAAETWDGWSGSPCQGGYAAGSSGQWGFSPFLNGILWLGVDYMSCFLGWCKLHVELLAMRRSSSGMSPFQVYGVDLLNLYPSKHNCKWELWKYTVSMEIMATRFQLLMLKRWNCSDFMVMGPLGAIWLSACSS